MSLHLGRTKKLDHQDTISYEIKMFRYCYDQLRNPETKDAFQSLAIEGFLLHHRNIARFFSGTHKRKGDLTVSDIVPHTPQSWIDVARQIDKKYHDPISVYLSHCTKIRAEIDRDWPIGDMFQELDRIIQEYVNLVSVSNVR